MINRKKAAGLVPGAVSSGGAMPSMSSACAGVSEGEVRVCAYVHMPSSTYGLMARPRYDTEHPSLGSRTHGHR